MINWQLGNVRLTEVTTFDNIGQPKSNGGMQIWCGDAGQSITLTKQNIADLRTLLKRLKEE